MRYPFRPTAIGHCFIFSLVLIMPVPTGAADTASHFPLGMNLFEENDDIGDVELNGSIDYDPESQTFTLSGSGSNMWEDDDQFFFAWRRMSGDFILSTNAEFIGEGVDPHRKLGWMIRASLAPDAPYVDLALHGDGLTSMQFRRAAGEDTEQLESEIEAPQILQLERRKGRYVMSVAQTGERLSSAELNDVELPDDVYVGLFICAHNPDVMERGRFENVRISIPAPEDFQPYQDYYGSRLEVMDVFTGRRRVVHTEPDSLQAPNWTRDGRALIYNRNGRLYRFDLESGQPAELDTGFATRNNNDHAISFDGKQLAISHHAEEFDGNSMVYTVPLAGGTPQRVTQLGPSYFHGWSPDGQWLTYTGGRDGQWDIYKIRSDGSGGEIRLTTHPALDDGSEFAPDGETIWFNSARSGTMEIWRMKTDGADPRRMTQDAYNNWFPHVSPDGQHVVYLAYLPDVAPEDHPWYRQVYLMMMPAQGGDPRVIANLYGGQGTINVPSWSPDSRHIAFVSNSVAK
jgi:TolB protein